MSYKASVDKKFVSWDISFETRVANLCKDSYTAKMYGNG